MYLNLFNALKSISIIHCNVHILFNVSKVTKTFFIYMHINSMHSCEYVYTDVNVLVLKVIP